jgi:hypothetical protein
VFKDGFKKRDEPRRCGEVKCEFVHLVSVPFPRLFSETWACGSNDGLKS